MLKRQVRSVALSFAEDVVKPSIALDVRELSATSGSVFATTPRGVRFELLTYSAVREDAANDFADMMYAVSRRASPSLPPPPPPPLPPTVSRQRAMSARDEGDAGTPALPAPPHRFVLARQNAVYGGEP